MSKLIVYLLIALPVIAQSQVVLYDRIERKEVRDYVIIVADSISDMTFAQSVSGSRCKYDLVVIANGYHSIRITKDELLPDTVEAFKMHHDLMEVQVRSERIPREIKSAAKRPRIEFTTDLGQIGYFIPTGNTCEWTKLTLHDVDASETKLLDSITYRIAWINLTDASPVNNPDSLFSAQIHYESDVLALSDRAGNRVDHVIELPQFEMKDFHPSHVSQMGIMLYPLDPVTLSGGQVENPLNSVIISPASLEGNVLSASGMFFGLDYTLTNK